MKPPSLVRHLWRWTLLALAAAWLALMLASYFAGLHESGEIADGHLATAAHVLLQLPDIGSADAHAPLITDLDEDLIPSGRHLKLANSVAVLVWEGGVLVADTRAPAQRGVVAFPDGYATTVVPQGPNQQPRHWRSFSAQRADGSRKVTTMIDLDQPTRIVREVAFTIARPSLVVLPLVALLLWWAIRRGLRPLHALSNRVAALDLQHSERLDASHGYAEFASTVAAINGLVTRLQTQALAERAFASDVAHELRTPLAAIALQAGVAARHPDAAGRAQALEALHQESLRAGQILAQLLDLARAQRPDNASMQAVCLDTLAAQVMAGFAQASYDSGHVLELQCGPDAVQVQGNPLLLELALRNLIDNALQHTPSGTQVVVSVARLSGLARLAVCDSGDPCAKGSGPAADRDTAHLGLGLRLVERIALLHGALLVRDNGIAPISHCFTIEWSADGFAKDTHG
ncbi:MAG: histidine kinase dimerization/phospho-acceptor domain-containing protein [Burkholderiaceae bacterium]